MGAPKKSNLYRFIVEIGNENEDKMLVAKEMVDPKRTNPQLRFITPYIYELMVAEIYSVSYVVEWDDMLEIQFANKHSLTLDTVQFFMKIFLHVELFSQLIHKKHNVITSGEIQKGWKEMQNIQRRKGEIEEMYLVPITNLRRKQGLLPKKLPLVPEVTHTGQKLSTSNLRKKPVVSSEVTPISSEETIVTSEETPISSEVTPPANHYMKYQDNNNNTLSNNTSLIKKDIVNTNVVYDDVVSSEETGVSSEVTRVSSEETGVSSEVSLMALLPIERCMQEFLNNDLCSRSKMRFYQWGDFLKDESLAARWLAAYNRSLEISNTDNKVLNDYCTHAFYWLKKQVLTKNPDDINSTSRATKKDPKNFSVNDTVRMTKEELDEFYAYNPTKPNG